MKLQDIKRMIVIDYWNCLLEIKKKGETYKGDISKKTGISYVQCFLILQKFKEMGLVEEEKQGRCCLIKLTPRGESLAKVVDSIWKIK